MASSSSNAEPARAYQPGTGARNDPSAAAPLAQGAPVPGATPAARGPDTETNGADTPTAQALTGPQPTGAERASTPPTGNGTNGAATPKAQAFTGPQPTSAEGASTPPPVSGTTTPAAGEGGMGGGSSERGANQDPVDAPTAGDGVTEAPRDDAVLVPTPLLPALTPNTETQAAPAATQAATIASASRSAAVPTRTPPIVIVIDWVAGHDQAGLQAGLEAAQPVIERLQRAGISVRIERGQPVVPERHSEGIRRSAAEYSLWTSATGPLVLADFAILEGSSLVAQHPGLLRVVAAPSATRGAALQATDNAVRYPELTLARDFPATLPDGAEDIQTVHGLPQGPAAHSSAPGWTAPPSAPPSVSTPPATPDAGAAVPPAQRSAAAPGHDFQPDGRPTVEPTAAGLTGSGLPALAHPLGSPAQPPHPGHAVSQSNATTAARTAPPNQAPPPSAMKSLAVSADWGASLSNWALNAPTSAERSHAVSAAMTAVHLHSDGDVATQPSPSPSPQAPLAAPFDPSGSAPVQAASARNTSWAETTIAGNGHAFQGDPERDPQPAAAAPLSRLYMPLAINAPLAEADATARVAAFLIHPPAAQRNARVDGATVSGLDAALPYPLVRAEALEPTGTVAELGQATGAARALQPFGTSPQSGLGDMPLEGTPPTASPEQQTEPLPSLAPIVQSSQPEPPSLPAHQPRDAAHQSPTQPQPATPPVQRLPAEAPTHRESRSETIVVTLDWSQGHDPWAVPGLMEQATATVAPLRALGVQVHFVRGREQPPLAATPLQQAGESQPLAMYGPQGLVPMAGVEVLRGATLLAMTPSAARVQVMPPLQAGASAAALQHPWGGSASQNLQLVQVTVDWTEGADPWQSPSPPVLPPGVVRRLADQGVQVVLQPGRRVPVATAAALAREPLSLQTPVGRLLLPEIPWLAAAAGNSGSAQSRFILRPGAQQQTEHPALQQTPAERTQRPAAGGWTTAATPVPATADAGVHAPQPMPSSQQTGAATAAPYPGPESAAAMWPGEPLRLDERLPERTAESHRPQASPRLIAPLTASLASQQAEAGEPATVDEGHGRPERTNAWALHALQRLTASGTVPLVQSYRPLGVNVLYYESAPEAMSEAAGGTPGAPPAWRPIPLQQLTGELAAVGAQPASSTTWRNEPWGEPQAFIFTEGSEDATPPLGAGDVAAALTGRSEAAAPNGQASVATTVQTAQSDHQRTQEHSDSQPSVDVLARQVYAVIRQRLAVERERTGRRERW